MISITNCVYFQLKKVNVLVLILNNWMMIVIPNLEIKEQSGDDGDYWPVSHSFNSLLTLASC
jgi:hypothetical protein